ncbi:hypothetical protein IV102_21055 [bacterium]|nr:hypothetical protein [bacterium]
MNYYAQWQEKRRREAAGSDTETETGTITAIAARPEDAPEFFEWTEDRERAIQECLETTVPGTLPTVHLQLQSVLQALKHGNLTGQQAYPLIRELEVYLDGKVRHEERKVPVAHPSFLVARADKLKALYAWEEACRSLREFVRDGQVVQLEVAAYAAEQGSAFLAGVRRTLLEAEPFEDEDEDEDELAEAAHEVECE